MKRKEFLILIILAMILAIPMSCCTSSSNDSSTTSESSVKTASESGSFSNKGVISDKEIVTDIFHFEKACAGTDDYDLKSFKYNKEGIDYRIFVLGNGYEDASIFVINETKEKLEIQLLKKQLENYY